MLALNLVNDFKAILNSVDVVSFDFFDTLFIRLIATPESVFRLVGEKFGIPNFLELRKSAQTRAFQRMHSRGLNEITLLDIYECMEKGDYDPFALMQAEYDLEVAVVRPNPQVRVLYDLAVAAGKMVVLTSDMYLPEAYFQNVCGRYKFDFNKYFVSADCNATKRDRGDLFQQVIDHAGCNPSRIVHIGDNAVSDIERGKQKGVRTLHYLPPEVVKKDWDCRLSTATLVEGVARAVLYEPADANGWFTAGYRHGGPAVYGFARWIAEQARKDDVDLVLFVSRDGYILKEVWGRLDLSDTPSAYFLGSRVAFTLAVINDLNFEHYLPFLLSGSENLLVSELFERIGVVPAPDGMLKQLGLTLDTVITDERKHDLSQLVWNYRKEILQHCFGVRKSLVKYLNDVGLRDNQKVAFIDVGWAGTTQDAFEKVVADFFFDVQVKGYYFALVDTPSARERSARLDMKAMFSPNDQPAERMADIYRNRIAAEMFFSAPHGPVIGYRLHPDDRRVLPILDQERGIEYDMQAVLGEINAGALAFCQTYHDLTSAIRHDTHVVTAAEALVSMICAPSPEEAAMFSALYNFDAWGSSANYRIYLANLDAHADKAAKGDMWPAAIQVMRKNALT